MELEANQIQEILPHRPPFLLVDRITGGEPGVWAQGIKCVTVNEPFFAGHFPGYHVMPGVLIMEALAQVGAVAILSLPEKYRMVLYLHYYQGYTALETAEILGKNASTVRTWLVQARGKLKEILEVEEYGQA